MFLQASVSLGHILIQNQGASSVCFSDFLNLMSNEGCASMSAHTFSYEAAAFIWCAPADCWGSTVGQPAEMVRTPPLFGMNELNMNVV